MDIVGGNLFEGLKTFFHEDDEIDGTHALVREVLAQFDFQFIVFLHNAICDVAAATFTGEVQTDYVAEYQRLPDNDLFQGNWQKNELTNTEHFMSFTDYIPNVFPQNEDAEHWPRGYCADDRSIYSLDTYYSKGENGEYTMFKKII